MTTPAVRLALPTPEQIADALAAELVKQLPGKWWVDVGDATGSALMTELAKRVDIRALQADIAASLKPPEVSRGGEY